MATFENSRFIDVPIKHHKRGGRAIDMAALKDLKASDSKLSELLHSKGVYTFTLRAAKGRRPWYVGKSERTDFLREAFNSRNLNLLNELINNRKGTLEVSFVTEVRKRGKPNLREIGEIEYLLIGAAARRNPELINKHHTAGDTFSIKNIYNSGSGRRSKTQAEFADVFGM